MIVYKQILANRDYQRIANGDPNAKILSVGEQNGELILWYVVDEEKAKGTTNDIHVYVVGTGHTFRPEQYYIGDFIGTVQMFSGTVWHIFAEVTNNEKT